MRRFVLALVLLGAVMAVGAASAGAAGYTITTVAGPGSGIDITLAGDQMALALQRDGSLLIAERANGQIRKISPNGTVTVEVAYVPGSQPTGIAVAPDGETFYFAEWGGRRVRRVDPGGAVVTVAGNGTGGTPVGIPGIAGASTFIPYGLETNTDGDLYVTLSENNRVAKIDAGADKIVDAGDPISFVPDSGVSTPTDVLAEDDGSYLIVSFGSLIHRVDGAGISVFAGSTSGTCGGATLLCGDGRLAVSATLANPWYITRDGSGGYLFTDYWTRRVRRVDAHGIISTVAGTGDQCASTTALCGDGGPPNNAAFRGPSGIVRDPVSGIVYIADLGGRIRAIVPNPTVQGAQGDQGPDGDRGADGGDGADGFDGADGPAGADGVNGRDGSNGANGVDGRDGPDGPQGRNGAAGADGVPGADGVRALRLPLVAVLPASRVSRSHRAAITLSSFVLGPAELRVVVTRNGRRIRSVSRSVKSPGRVNLNLGRLKRGRYRVTLTAKRGAETVIDRSELIVR